MGAKQAAPANRANIWQRLLFRFQLHIDDISAKPQTPVPCVFSIVALTVYHGISMALFWVSANGMLLTTVLNGLCVLRGLCKVWFDREAYRGEMRQLWSSRTCNMENEEFIRGICRPYSRLFTIELVPLISFAILLVCMLFDLLPSEVSAGLIGFVGTITLLAVFVGDLVDVLADMYRARPAMLRPDQI